MSVIFACLSVCIYLHVFCLSLLYCCLSLLVVAGTISHTMAESHNLVQGFQKLEQDNQELGVAFREDAELKFLLGEKKATWTEVYKRAMTIWWVERGFELGGRKVIIR